MVLRTISLFVDAFIKTFPWKSLTKNKVKGHIYLDKFVMGSIYVMKYRFPRKSRKSGFLSSWAHLKAWDSHSPQPPISIGLNVFVKLQGGHSGRGEAH